MIKIPKLLQSLVALSRFKVGCHLREEIDQQNLEVRNKCRRCLKFIQECCDEQVQIEIVKQGYGRVMSISICTAGGKGEEQDEEIYYGLRSIYLFLRELHLGRYNDWQPSFQPLPLLVRRSEEQMEEEGANEEIDTQMKNNGLGGGIKSNSKWAKEVILNHFILGG
ncbi:MAG: hypothetical protein EZS28_050576 [Streblomastix strix]|uniref:Uncharacterized protein n=1 Tax=Streblomastix strix TaxID=222440 RepID=A0A5J4T6L8_9EUKA|nr:MAG: hypothetical protein EZS28_050576 [Streblomastix strix]